MTTGLDVVSQALFKAGITGRGITPSNADTQDALADLNDMIGQWQAERFLVWHQVNIGFVGDGRTTPYLVGPGGDYNVTSRPERIYSAFLRQLQNVGSLLVDTPLHVIESFDEYNRIPTKNLASFPEAVFLDTAWPTGNLFVYPWPSPAGLYSVFIGLKDIIPVITTGTSLAALPPPYVPAFKFNLARRLRQSYGKGMRVDRELNLLANSSLDTLTAYNLQLPEMGMPISLMQRGAGYNIYSDRFGT